MIISYARDNIYIFLAQSLWCISSVIGSQPGLIVHIDNLQARSDLTSYEDRGISLARESPLLAQDRNYRWSLQITKRIVDLSTNRAIVIQIEYPKHTTRSTTLAIERISIQDQKCYLELLNAPSRSFRNPGMNGKHLGSRLNCYHVQDQERFQRNLYLRSRGTIYSQFLQIRFLHTWIIGNRIYGHTPGT